MVAVVLAVLSAVATAELHFSQQFCTMTFISLCLASTLPMIPLRNGDTGCIRSAIAAYPLLRPF